MLCECGCGYEGPDEITQYLLEEACMTALELHDAREHTRGIEQLANAQAITAAQEQVKAELDQLQALERGAR